MAAEVITAVVTEAATAAAWVGAAVVTAEATAAACVGEAVVAAAATAAAWVGAAFVAEEAIVAACVGAEVVAAVVTAAAWAGAAATAAVVTEEAALALPAVEEVVAVTAVTACPAYEAAEFGCAALATLTTCEIKLVAESEEMLARLFCTTLEIVSTACCMTTATSGLVSAASARDMGGCGRPPGGVIEIMPALMVNTPPAASVKVTASAVAAMEKPPLLTETEYEVPRAAATPFGVRTP